MRLPAPVSLRLAATMFALTGALGFPVFALAQSAPPQGPPLPDPAPITVDPTSTALLVLDVTTGPCTTSACMATLTPIAQLLANARSAGAFVVYSLGSAPGQTVLPQVAPQPGDPSVSGHADKFFGTNLDQILQSHGIKTLVVTGYAANGAVLYTAWHANELGYTVAVAEDGTGGDSPFAAYAAEWQLLNEPGFTNANNQPLQPTAVTLTLSNLVTFAGSGSGSK